ncbi:MutS family DNA mismatch repair protein [Methanosarcina barkeri]|uniref:Intracellular protein transport protein USO1 n=1 Tax=Methanosarcina barkeri 227 TaxID=1434106 RepID=A0A0E3R773_METBA|nr:hypothetical protein [Methanosarcina barkeri]AKB59487.1 Intracellular protein transport protein USO1 [Methanosarcina barkeri 227]
MDTLDNVIRERENWLKILVIGSISISVILLLFFIIFKLMTGSVVLNFNNFSFSDILSLVLSMFSIYISALFYFKATDTSNKFYDNTYKFTQDVSVILGRIEAGFGEKLRHLDEGYTNMNEKIISLKLQEITKQSIEQEQKKGLQIKENERSEIIVELANKAKMKEDEKESILRRLKEKDEEIYNFKSRLSILEKDASIISENPKLLDIVLYLKQTFFKTLDPKLVVNFSDYILKEEFQNSKFILSNFFLQDMLSLGFVDSDCTLTPEGALFIREVAQDVNGS